MVLCGGGPTPAPSERGGGVFVVGEVYVGSPSSDTP